VDNSKQQQQKQNLSCGQFKATTTKTDEVSIKPKYIQITKKY